MISSLRSSCELISRVQPMRIAGSVAALRGLILLVDDLPAPVGTLVTIEPSAAECSIPGEIVGFDNRRAIVMLLGATSGLKTGDRVVAQRTAPTIRASTRLLGRVLNGMGDPIDNGPPLRHGLPVPITAAPVTPLKRRRIRERLTTGVRAMDLITPAGRGQRLGVFAGPGVGKSTLLATIARNTEADVNVIALVGERGREVREFIEDALGAEGLARSVVVVATSDESPLLRVRSFFVACAIAEHFRAQGADVSLLMDSITRFAHAQRQIGLAVGEPPATKGYTPSVFALLPQVLERAGAVEGEGSITGFYTILVEGDDLTEPISDAARGVLDGHIILSRDLAQRGHYPAIDVLDSISRLAEEVSDVQHTAARTMILKLLAAYRDVQDLLQIGAYASGSNPTADVAIHLKSALDDLLQQSPRETESFKESKSRMLALAVEAGTLLQQVESAAPAPRTASV